MADTCCRFHKGLIFVYELPDEGIGSVINSGIMVAAQKNPSSSKRHLPVILSSIRARLFHRLSSPWVGSAGSVGELEIGGISMKVSLIYIVGICD